MIAFGASAEQVTPEEALIAAVNHCSLQDLEAVFQNYRPDVNYLDERGESALHIVNKYSICGGSNALKFEILKALVAHGANVNLYDANRETPLLALLEGFADLAFKRPAADFLLKNGADPNRSGGRGQRPITVVGCSAYGRTILDSLLKAGGDINSQNVETGWTMIFFNKLQPNQDDVANFGECLDYFKKNGGNFEVKDNAGDSALTFVLKNIDNDHPDLARMAEVLQLLAKNGADLNFVNDEGDSGILILAKFAARQTEDAYPKTRALFDVFIDHKANLNLRDRAGKTAFAILKAGKQMGLAKFLFAYGAKD